MADASTHHGMREILVSRTDPVLPSVDAAFGAAVADALGRHGVEGMIGCAVKGIATDKGSLWVCFAGGTRVAARNSMTA